MFIEETHDAFGLSCSDFDTGGDMMDIVQQGNWIQIDKHQASQLIAVLQKWVDGGEVE